MAGLERHRVASQRTWVNIPIDMPDPMFHAGAQMTLFKIFRGTRNLSRCIDLLSRQMRSSSSTEDQILLKDMIEMLQRATEHQTFPIAVVGEKQSVSDSPRVITAESIEEIVDNEIGRRSRATLERALGAQRSRSPADSWGPRQLPRSPLHQ